MTRIPLLVLAVSLLASCEDRLSSEVQVPAAEFGERLFHSPALSRSQFNRWSCATCHTAGTADDRILSGYDLGGVTRRSRTWGGASRDLLTTVNFCLVYFMRGDPLTREDERGRQLYEFLDQAQGSTETRPFTVVKNVDDVPRGDPARGEAVYRAACLDCHGEKDTGDGRNTELASVLPNVKEDYAELFPGVEPGLVFIEKVRHGQFYGVGGNMPLYSLEALSDADLGALLAYLGL